MVGVIGDPIIHSLSPAMHNAAFAKMDLDWCYLALGCNVKNLEQALKGLLSIGCLGLNITIPHKKAVINICEETSNLAKRIGAVNTLIPNKNGGWYGTNTDLQGFLEPLIKTDFKGSNAIILGCGGSARAIGVGLEELGFKNVTVIARKQSSLDIFLKEINNKSSSLSNSKTIFKGLLEGNKDIIQEIKSTELIINTTPVGMTTMSIKNKEISKIPLGKEIWENLHEETTLYDLIYNPRPTPWLELGKKQGCQTIDGLEMLVAQGAASLKLWSLIENIPINEMRNAALKELKELVLSKD